VKRGAVTCCVVHAEPQSAPQVGLLLKKRLANCDRISGHGHQFVTEEVYGALFAAIIQPYWAWFDGVLCVGDRSLTCFAGIVVGQVSLLSPSKVLCVLGLSDKSRRVMFLEWSPVFFCERS
jgi:hypothetical protein